MVVPLGRVVVAVVLLAKADGQSISIIIPVYNEASNLDRCLANLRRHNALENVEIIVSEASDCPLSEDISATHGCLFTRSVRGRAQQMNTGSRLASRDCLLFLHVDTQLPETFNPSSINLKPSGQGWGFFRVRLSGKSPLFRCIEWFMNGRSRLTQVATGDQTLFFDKNFFDRLGGFPELPIMEDIAMSKLARSHSRPKIIRLPVTTSSRRWEQNGIIKTILLMWGLRFAYWIGVSPRKIHRIYYPEL